MRDKKRNILILLIITASLVLGLSCKRKVPDTGDDPLKRTITKEFKDGCEEFNYLIDLALETHLVKTPADKEQLYKSMLTIYNNPEISKIEYSEANIKNCAYQKKHAETKDIDEKEVMRESLKVFMLNLDAHSVYCYPKCEVFNHASSKNIINQSALASNELAKASTSSRTKDFWNVDNVKVGYIKIAEFWEKSADEFGKNLSDLKAKDMDGLILDLRKNGGGYEVMGVKVASKLLKKRGSKEQDIIVAHRTRKKGIVDALDRRYDERFKNLQEPPPEKYYIEDTAGDGFYEDPLILVFDNGSASATEILIGAARDHKRAVLLGESKKTFGKGTVQVTWYVAPYTFLGGQTMVTTYEWRTPAGKWFQKDGKECDLASPSKSRRQKETRNGKGIYFEEDYGNFAIDGSNDIMNTGFIPPSNDLESVIEELRKTPVPTGDTIEYAKHLIRDWVKFKKTKSGS